MIIAGVNIPKGEKVTVDIPISRLPSNTQIDMIAHVYRSEKEGPTLLVIGGVHGDELNGIEIIKRAERSKMFAKIKCGNVIAVPLLNVYGFLNYSRGVPDGKDVNRSFPGTKKGSLASRVAYTFTKEILPHADIALDMHTGGGSIYNFPQSRAYAQDEEAIKLAEDFGMPLLIKGRLINKSLRKTAYQMGIPLVVFEGGESQRMDEKVIQKGLDGIERVMIARGMIEGEMKRVRSKTIVDGTWIRASRSGILKVVKKSGAKVKKGDLLGTISGPYGLFEVKVKARKDGIIYGHNNQPVINQGSALFHIGYTA